MKTLIKKLPLVAFVFAIAAAFAFNVPEERSTSWFAVDVDGNISTTAISNPNCSQTIMDYCAVEFDNADLIGGQPPIENVEEPGASSVYVKLTYREL